MSTRELERRAQKEAFGFIIVVALVVLVLMCAGCATAKPEFDSQGNVVGVTSYGFMRDVKLEQVKPDGSRFTLETKSTSADIMRAGNELIGTAAGIAEKVKP